MQAYGGMPPGAGSFMGMPIMPRTMETLAKSSPRPAEPPIHSSSVGGGTVAVTRPPPPSGPPPSAQDSNNLHLQSQTQNKDMNAAITHKEDVIGSATLPSHETDAVICTIRCTGVPNQVTETELWSHFSMFGRVVDLKLDAARMDHRVGISKTYGECFVQFSTPLEARKCVSSPLPVLNNRFIRVHFNNFNLIPPSSVPPAPIPPAPVPEQPRTMAQLNNSSPAAAEDTSRPSSGALASSFRRLPPPAAEVGRERSLSFSEQNRKGKEQRADSQEVIMVQYGDLRNLRLRSESLLRQKETLLQVSFGE